MPRPRKPDPTIPAHIDQACLPPGVYWDATGRGRWYVLIRNAQGKRARKTIATAAARLSDLHSIAEDTHTPGQGTLAGLCDLFEKSPKWKALSPSTRRDYTRSRTLICDTPTKLGLPFGSLNVDRLSSAVVQRLVDQIADTRGATTGAHALQYLRRVVRWSKRRGFCATNPVQDIEAPTLTPRRILPTESASAALLAFARERGARPAHTAGSVAPYLWICMELATLCHMRGIEIITLRESAATRDCLTVERRKGSRTTEFDWNPRLRAAWDAAIAYRDQVWKDGRNAVPIRADMRPVIVNQSGIAISRSGLDSAWQRLIHMALRERVITPEQRFSLHPLKRKGITDRKGTKAEKMEASGHASAQMLNVYDFSRPRVKPSDGV